MTSRSVLLEYAAKTVYWLMLAVSVWILLRGHNAPGGGFIAGLVAVAATALVAIVYGVDQARRRLPLRPLYLAVTGVLLALLSGMPGVWADAPFLTHQWWSVEFADTSLKLSTVILFDLGVYGAVWGAFASYLFALLDEGGAVA
jgi:multisubunit Na+/H+ antiporter MnhB subunit